MLSEVNWTEWLPLLALPVVGAFIGYITNTVAIRMLFRPLRAWKVFGIRIPLTPGIIPAKRQELAAKIGQMVGNHLLTSEDVGRALEKPHFQRELHAALGERLNLVLDRELGSIQSLIPKGLERHFEDLSRVVRLKIADSVFELLGSPGLEDDLRRWLTGQRDRWLQRDLESCLSPEDYGKLQSRIDTKVRQLLQSPLLADGTARLVDQRLEQLLASEKSLRELLPQDLIELLLGQLEKELPPMLEKFGGLLHDPAFRAKLTKRIKAGIESFLDSLDGLTAIIGAFVSMEQIHAHIPKVLDKAGEEIARWLQEETTQTQIATLIRVRIDNWLDRPMHSFVDRLSYEKVAGVRAFAREKAVLALQSPRTAEAVVGLLERGFQQIKDRPFNELMQEMTPSEQWDGWWNQAVDHGLRQIRGAEARQAFDCLLGKWMEQWLTEVPLGPLSSRFPEKVRLELEPLIYQQLTELLKKEVPPLVEALNVERVVEEKVNALDVLQVEDLLLGIMREQFKYINLFGGLLGFLIGCLNLMITRLH